MYSTSEVANILEVTDRTVRNYILHGKLAASIQKNGDYQIGHKDLYKFESDFFYTDKRFEKRSKHYKRNIRIQKDAKNGMIFRKIAKKYFLSEKSVLKILSKI